MILDSQLGFVPVGSNLSLVAGAGVSTPSNVIDLLGAGVGVAPPNIIGNVTLFGEDPSVGAVKVEIEIGVGTAFTTSTSCTLNVQFQGAPDLGTPTYQPGTWATYGETGTIAVANLTANAIIRMDFPVVFPVGTRPRFLRLNFAVPSGEDFTAGTIAFAVVTKVRDDQANKYAANNFVVA